MKHIVLFLFGLVVSFTSSIDTAYADAERLLVEPTSDKISEIELGRYQYCATDKDCVWVINGCCDCANGGEEIAINKKFEEIFKKRFDCLNVSCTERTPIPPCGSGVVSCINHKCKYFSDDKF